MEYRRNEIEIAEGFYPTDEAWLRRFMTEEGIDGEIRDEIIRRIIERWDATDLLDAIYDWLTRDFGIEHVRVCRVFLKDFERTNPVFYTHEVLMEEFPQFFDQEFLEQNGMKVKTSG